MTRNESIRNFLETDRRWNEAMFPRDEYRKDISLKNLGMYLGDMTDDEAIAAINDIIVEMELEIRDAPTKARRS